MRKQQLQELALDLRWSWNHSADELWRRLDVNLWELTHNPWIILQTVSSAKLDAFAADPTVHSLLDQLLEQRHSAITSPAWYQTTHSGASLNCVAYFSMEFMLSEALPIYSGGLGNVAGDQLKAASDLGVPVIGVGLLYQRGYFRQEIDRDGRQRALYPYNDPGQLPITPVRDSAGEWIRVELQMPDLTLTLRTWQVQIGRTRLYLLDSNDAANLPVHRGITSELYGGGLDVRLKQELVLGLGGWRLLRALNLKPDVCHLNEGHAAFLTLERALDWMQQQQQPFEIAHAVTRAGNVFTTHTPVEAGFDRFPPDLLEPYLRPYAEQQLGISWDDFLALGRLDPHRADEPFNMAYLATRGSARVNGVSRLHGEVSRRIFQSLYPRWPTAEVPVDYVTNGVHVPTWDSAAADNLWTSSCGKERWTGSLSGVSENLNKCSDTDFWRLRSDSRRQLIEFVRQRLTRQLA
ncbi:MAG: alpha-glucan family phosphorylase, partial [Acidobacteriaceae bacterium]|nr:alpha-glucan family phosphorylase [Acidobacteriaceae bacterium]